MNAMKFHGMQLLLLTRLSCVALLSALLLPGCARTTNIADELKMAVCQEHSRTSTGGAMVDIGLLRISPPSGYKLSAGNSHHGGVQLWNGQRMIGISNGLWSGASFRARYQRQSPDPVCHLISNGIPVTVYSMSGEDGGYGPGFTFFGAIVEHPLRPAGEKVGQPLITAVIADGDTAHALALRQLIDSVRKGALSNEAILPASEAKAVSH